MQGLQKCRPASLRVLRASKPAGRSTYLHVFSSMVGSRLDAVGGQELRDLLSLHLEGGIRNDGTRRGEGAARPQQLQQRLPCGAGLCACIFARRLLCSQESVLCLGCERVEPSYLVY